MQGVPILRLFMTVAESPVPSKATAVGSEGRGHPMPPPRPEFRRVTCRVPVLQVRSRLLLHPLLRGRLAGRGSLLPQLQSSPGHLQALVGLGQTRREPRAAGSALRLRPGPAPGGGATSGGLLPPGVSPLCLLLGGKRLANVTHLQNPRGCCSELCAGHARDIPLECWSKGLPPSVTPGHPI